MPNNYYKDKSYRIERCFNIYNIMDNLGKVVRQCSTRAEAQVELAFFQSLVAETL